MLKKPVSSRRSPSEKRPSTSALVIWSAATTPSASANQRHALRMRATLPRAVEIELAPSAERFVVHVGAVMPAPLAFLMSAWLHLDIERTAMNVGGRGKHHELEVFAKAAQDVEVLAFGVKLDFRLQRRADLACRA